MADDRRRRWLILLGAAAAAGVVAGAMAVYFMAGEAGNPAVAVDCAPAAASLRRLAPLAHGEVAAFRVADAPDKLDQLAFKGPDGADLTLAAFAGKTVLVNFWATWCVPCRTEMPALDRLEAAKGGKDFEVVAVNLDLHDPDHARAFLADNKVRSLAFYSDPSNGAFARLKRRGLTIGLPTTLLLDRHGCSLGVMEGPAAWDSADAAALIASAAKIE
jgi:thiol-disulfide isomerase/thioredoxin